MTDNEEALLEALGEITEQRKALEAKEKELRSALSTLFEGMNGAGALATRNFSINFSMNAGRRTLDKKSLEEDGIDLEPYYKVGKPFMTLKVARIAS